MANSETSTAPLLLRLSDADNIAVAVRALAAGTRDMGVTLTQPVPVGHKVALRAIAAGEKIVKWGMPIGSATQSISAGEHVHTHNLKSDYLPTFTLDDGKKFVEDHP